MSKMATSFYINVLTIIVIHIILTRGVVSGNADYRLEQRAVDANALCKSPSPIGLACQACSEVVRCSCAAKNKCTTSHVRTCAAGTVCKDGKCVSGNTCIPSDQPQFICSSTGMFPDPYNCQAYHFCVPDATSTKIDHTSATCTDDDNGQKYGYNPITTFCSTKLLNNKCSAMPIQTCKRPLDTGVVGNNPNLYYLCLNTTEGDKETEVLYPYQFACEHGTKFNTGTGDCR